MKTCLLSARFPPQRCGVGDYTYFLAGALARIGHHVDILTAAAGDFDESLYPLPANVRVHRVIASWGAGGLGEMIKQVRELDPETLLIQYTPHSFDRRGMTLAVNLLPAILRVSQGIRVVTNFHELYIPFNHSIKRNLGALWQRSAAILLASGSHAISVTAGEWERRLKEIGIRKRVPVIPVGSNIPRVTVSHEEHVYLRKQILGSAEGFLVVGFGAWRDRDIPAALGALRRLKRRGPAKMVWIGGGNLDDRHRVAIEQALRANGLTGIDVEWTGVLPHPQVSRFLSVCDGMILPFIDGVSTRRTSAVTALQHGLPLLTTQGPRPEPWFVHGQNVYLTPVGDTNALEEALVELAETPELRTRLGQGARELFDAHFAWDVIAEQVTRLAEHG